MPVFPAHIDEKAPRNPMNPGDNGDNSGDNVDNPVTVPGEVLEGADQLAGDEQSSAGGGPPRSSSSGRFLNPDGSESQQRFYDWDAIRHRYVEGVKTDRGVEWPSLGDVALHFDLPANRIREKAAQQGWTGQRKAWQAQAEATRRQARAAALSKEATDLDSRALDSAKSGIQLCSIKLAALTNEVARARQEAGPGGAADKAAAAAVDALEMTRLAQAIDLFHKLGLRAVGDPETHRVELTGPNGRPIEISAELQRDDPSRLTGVLAVLTQAGLGDLFGAGADGAAGAVAVDPGDVGGRAAIEARR